ncbi:hypothetical protein AX14_010939, partial [Amanita brunnescens Koide BX004]
ELPVSRTEVERAAKYLQCAVTFYEDDARRQDAIRGLVDEAIGQEVDGTTAFSSWSWSSEHIGLSGDALLQAVVDYSKIVSRQKFKRFREFCNFPIVFVGATANRLEIAVAVWFHASDNIIRLTRVFGSLSRCRAELKSYYDRVRNLDFPRLSCLYPNPTLLDPSKALPQLTYKRFLSRAGQPTSMLVDLGNATTAMYTATLGDANEDVIVKFTTKWHITYSL